MGCLENEWVGLKIHRPSGLWGFDSPSRHHSPHPLRLTPDFLARLEISLWCDVVVRFSIGLTRLKVQVCSRSPTYKSWRAKLCRSIPPRARFCANLSALPVLKSTRQSPALVPRSRLGSPWKLAGVSLSLRTFSVCCMNGNRKSRDPSLAKPASLTWRP